jgi:hypothetical protein
VDDSNLGHNVATLGADGNTTLDACEQIDFRHFKKIWLRAKTKTKKKKKKKIIDKATTTTKQNAS